MGGRRSRRVRSGAGTRADHGQIGKRVGPEGRKSFEQFLRKVNKLQVQKHLEAQAQMGVTERSGEQGAGLAR
jgi:hypothetical protein